jgi:hypothetical protein
MERTQLFDLMGELKLYGMKAAFDEIMATAIKRQHEPQRIVGDLLTAEISEKQARSIKYQLTIAKLPLAKDIDDFQFDGTPTLATTTRDFATRFLIALVGRSERLIEKPTLDQDWFWQLARRGRSRRARPPVSRIGTGWRRRTFENYLPRANGWQW